MEIDKELLDMFTEELGQLKGELNPIVESLIANPQQPQLFTDFAQIIDRIYGTATTMGFDDIGKYTGVIRNMTRKTGSSKVPRAMPEVLKVMKNCMENFGIMQTSLANPAELKVLQTKMKLEIGRCDKIDATIFAYSKTAKTTLMK